MKSKLAKFEKNYLILFPFATIFFVFFIFIQRITTYQNTVITNNLQLIFLSILIGFLTVMLFHNVSLYICLHEKQFIYYSIALFFIILFYVNIFKVFNLSYNNYSPIYKFAIIITSSIFINEYFNFSNCKFRSIKSCILFGTLIASLFGILLQFFTLYWSNIIATSLITLQKVCFLIISIMAIKEHGLHIKYLVWINIIIFSESVIWLSGYYHFFLSRNNALYMSIILTWLMTISFSLILADRFISIQKEKQTIINITNKTIKKTNSSILATQKSQINKRILQKSMDESSKKCLSNPDDAIDILLTLSDYLHNNYSFDYDNILVPINEELVQLETYVKLEKAITHRDFTFAYRLNYSEELYIYPMILQPLVENSLVHSQDKCNLRIVVSIEEMSDKFKLSVEDNGCFITEESIYSVLNHLGSQEYSQLEQVNANVFKLYGNHLIIDSKKNIGTIIRFEIPKEQNNEGRIS